MKRKMALAALALCFAVTGAFAEAPKGTAAPAKASAAQLTAMKAEFAKCAVCKNMLTHFDELAPVMTMEVVTLDNGAAIMHGVTDPTKVAMFQSSCDAVEKAGAATATMTDEQVKTQLCSFCQDIHSSMKAGAHMSNGHTKNGSMMVLTSDDPKVQAQITALAQKCAMMAAGQQASR